MAGLTLDSGAFIAFERADRRIVAHLKQAEQRGCELTVSTAVVAEVWRKGRRSARMGELLGACVIEPVDEELARSAGEALARVRDGEVVDAIVRASAARCADRVLATDADDMTRLQAPFPSVRVIPL